MKLKKSITLILLLSLLLTGCRDYKNYFWYIVKTNVLSLRNEKKIKDVTIALLDSGFNYEYSNFINTDNFYECYDFVDNDVNIDTKVNMHGTRLAMLICSKEYKNFTGIDDDIKIINLKVIEDDGSTNNEILHNAFNYLKKFDVDVINLSFGGSVYSQTLYDDINYFVDNGVYVISSVGDNLQNEFFYPSLYDGVFAVTAVDENNVPYSFTNTSNLKKSIYCPGVNITIPILNSINKFEDTFFSGSSYATALFSGIIASALSKGSINENNLENYNVYNSEGFLDCTKILKN